MTATCHSCRDGAGCSFEHRHRPGRGPGLNLGPPPGPRKLAASRTGVVRVQALLGVGVAEADGAAPPAGGLVVESVAFEDPRHSADGTCSEAVLLRARYGHCLSICDRARSQIGNGGKSAPAEPGPYGLSVECGQVGADERPQSPAHAQAQRDERRPRGVPGPQLLPRRFRSSPLRGCGAGRLALE